MTKGSKRRNHAVPKQAAGGSLPRPKSKEIIRRSHSNGSKRNALGSTGQRTARNATTAATPVKGKVPFSKRDRVLLVGEGDFSFALSLAQHHRVASIVATSFDPEAAVLEKYPHARQTLVRLGASQQPPPQPDSTANGLEAEEFVGFSPSASPPQQTPDDPALPLSPDAAPSNPAPPPSKSPTTTTTTTILHHGIDATRLSTTHRKALLRSSTGGQRFTKIVFNFPHTGGRSTDINRQTRANQQLIRDFFVASLPLLVVAPPHLAPDGSSPPPAPPPREPPRCKSERYDTPSSPSPSPSPSGPDRRAPAPFDDPYHHEDEEDEEETSQPPPGQILVTLFAGEAYESWNIRDVARSVGLKVVESFRFPWARYPGYAHARTVGEIRGRRGRGRDEEPEAEAGDEVEVEGDRSKRPGRWRGEEREARMFVFEVDRRDEGGGRSEQRIGSRKRKKTTGRDDSDGDGD